MNRATVSLSQILSATAARAATMVPESAGYLTLALCDAIGYLPVKIHPSAVQISPEGAVSVAEQGAVLSGPEAAKRMRELLAELLASSAGGAGRLAAVAKPRAINTERGLDAVAIEIEAALVPLNRAAARRTLGRLAKETARAADAGLLKEMRALVEPARMEPPAEAKKTPPPRQIKPIAPPSVKLTPPPQKPTAFLAPPSVKLTPPPKIVEKEAPVLAPAPASAPATAPAAAPASASNTPGFGVEILLTPGLAMPVQREPTPTVKDPFSFEVETATSARMDVFEPSPAPASPTPTSLMTPLPPPPARASESTLLSARDAAVVPAERAPLVEIEAPSTTKGEIPAKSAPAPSSPASVPSILSNGPIRQELREAEKRAIIEHTLPWPVGLGMPQPLGPMSQPAVEMELVSIKELTPSAEELLSFEFEVLSPAPKAAAKIEPPESPPPVPTISPAPAASDALSPSGGLSHMLAELGVASSASPASAEPVVSPVMPVSELAPDALHTAEPTSVEAKEVVPEKPADEAPVVVVKAAPGGRDRVSDLLDRFARPEGGDEALLKATASSLKELAGLEPTPYMPPASPAIRIAPRPEGKTPEWLPQASREPVSVKPAPLVPAPKRGRSRIMAALAFFLGIGAFAGVAVWKNPQWIERWLRAVAPAAANPQASADDVGE